MRHLLANLLLLGIVGGSVQAIAAGYDQSRFAVAYRTNLAHTGSISFGRRFTPPLAQIWSVNIGEGAGGALIAKNTVFVTGAGVDVFALDLSTGAQKWEQSLDCCNEQGAYDNGMLFFLSGSGELTSLSAKTGSEVWKIQLTGETSFPAPPIAASGQVIASGEGEDAVAYSANEKDGGLLWTQNITGAGLPSLADGGLFLTSGCFYYRLNPLNGAIVWSSEQCVGGGWESSAYAYKRLYVPGIPTGNIVSARSGSVLGTYPTWDFAPALFTDDKGKELGLSIGNNDLVCWNAKTGKQLWQFTSQDEMATPPIVINGIVYVADTSTLYALDQKNGKQIWSDTFGGAYPAALTAAQGTLVVTTSSEVIAYRPH